jgi:hypothetical protein
LELDKNPPRHAFSPAGPLALADPVELVLDDGEHFSAWGVSCGTDAAKQFIWLNRFTPEAAVFPFYLNQIWVLFDDDGGENNVQPGDAVDLVVYQDGDAELANGAVWLSTFHESILSVDGLTWSTYMLTNPVYLSGPGDVLIAVINRYVEDCVSPETYPATIDYSTNQGRSWMGWWEGSVPDPAALPPGDSFSQRTGNWMIRGYGETTDIIPTLTATLGKTPTRMPTVTQTPRHSPTPTRTATQATFPGDAYLPYVIAIWPPEPTATATPQLAYVYVANNTGGQLCYEIIGTGIGEKCFPEGQHLYGSFRPGTYEYRATASCGSKQGTKDFRAGEYTHSFYCTHAALSGEED